jgi:hypothetical protein
MKWGAGASRLPRIVRIAILVLVGYVVVPVALTEVAFRLYERYVLTSRLPPPGPEGVLDLSRLGYSNGPVSVTKPADEARILSLGDSFAYGIVTEAHNYNRVLERRLAAGTGRPFSIVNLGRPSTSFPDYQRELELWSRVLPHEAVILDIYAGNDFVEAAAMPPYVAGELEGSLAVAFSTGVQVPRRYPLRIMDHAYALYLSWATRGEPAAGYRATTRMSWDRYVQVMAGAAHVYQRSAPGRDWRELGPSYVHLRDLLARLEVERAAGAATLVFVSPPHLAVSERVRRAVAERTGVPEAALDFSLPGRLVRAVAEIAGYRGAVYDLLPCLHQHAEKGMELYRGTDTHWSVEGNRVVGDFLADLLGREWPRARAAQRASPCDPEVALAPRDEEVHAFMADRVARARVLAVAPLEPAALRALGRDLAAGRYPDRGAVESRLAGLGLRPSSGVVGFLDRVGPGSPDHVVGWAADVGARSPAVEVLVFAGGAAVGAGRPDRDRPDVAKALPFGVGPEARPGFDLAAPGACAAARKTDGLWLLAMSASRTYAWLGDSGPKGCG